jgi:hypothetical protein
VYLIMTKPSANCQPRMFCVLIGSSSMLVDAATSAAVPSKTSSPPELPNSWKSGASSRSSRAVFMPLRSAGQRQTVRASIPSRYAPISGHVVRAWASSARSQLTVRAVSAGGQPDTGRPSVLVRRGAVVDVPIVMQLVTPPVSAHAGIHGDTGGDSG